MTQVKSVMCSNGEWKYGELPFGELKEYFEIVIEARPLSGFSLTDTFFPPITHFES